ncbi:pseudouridine synthase [Stutzerimonas stutzeri]|uniref:Pseudouridine synthase n=1 Tax=Stutzerimonas stutzeri TaxID=316 RepID=W8RX33_STUST|nr:YqcC family protein [Stutzerimonas stutzeri]AHL76641.1 pseudouridine synthase [Stutzerimonas stutzeri]MCQ4331202.1 YqcC family protein [Stutzerimonas stutzeri]
MDCRIAELADQLLLIERELRVHDLWASSPPDAQALASQEPFCVDTLSFEQWLQWIFLPRMKTILERGEALPTVSGILAMAEVVYRGRSQQMAGLLRALETFDVLISRGEE